MNIPAIPFEQLPTEIALMRQELREMKELLKMKVSPVVSEYMDTKEAAKFLHTTPIALRQRIYSGIEIPHLKNGRLLFFKKSDLIEYLEEGRVETEAEIEAGLMDVLKIRKK